MKLFRKKNDSKVEGVVISKKNLEQEMKSNVKKEEIKVIGPERLKNEKASIFAKLIASHIFVGAIPVLVVAFIILNLAQSGILNEVMISNVNLTEKISEIVDMKLSNVEATSKLIVTDFDVLEVVAKNEEDYDDVYDFTKDRTDIITPMLSSIGLSNPYFENIMF